MSGSIYFIGCTETKRLKIGFTAGDPYKRLRTLQTGSPTRLVLLETYHGTIQDEQDLHRKFATERLHGEWFEMTERLFEHLCCVTFVNGKRHLELGAPLTDMTIRGLEMLHSDVAELPADLRSLIGGTVQ
jgi:hypothetical protein